MFIRSEYLFVNCKLQTLLSFHWIDLIIFTYNKFQRKITESYSCINYKRQISLVLCFASSLYLICRSVFNSNKTFFLLLTGSAKNRETNSDKRVLNVYFHSKINDYNWGKRERVPTLTDKQMDRETDRQTDRERKKERKKERRKKESNIEGNWHWHSITLNAGASECFERSHFKKVSIFDRKCLLF